MYNNFVTFLLQQVSLADLRAEKPSFYRNFVLDPQLNGPSKVGALPSLTRIGPDITFTRNSSATFINQAGNITTVNVNTPRFDWFNHRTNLLLASNNINSGSWTGYFNKSLDWAQNAVGPDNVVNTAWSLPFSAARFGPDYNTTGLIQTIQPLASGMPITVSVWARADNNSAGQITLGTTDGAGININPDLTTQWKRFSYSTFYNPGAVNGPRGTQLVILSGQNTNPNSKIYVYGFQCEVGTTATTFISSDESYVTVSEPKGFLIERERTNFIGQQNLNNWIQLGNTITAGTGIAGLPSYIIGDESSTEYGQVQYLYPTTLLSATTYNFSCYIKKRLFFNNNPLLRVVFNPGDVAPSNFAGIFFNQATGTATNAYSTTTSAISVQDFTTYYRASFTFNSQSSAIPYRVDIIPSHGSSPASPSLSGTSIEIAGLQTELGTFPSSYIPTAGNAYTRTADDATITGTSFSNLYNKNASTVFSDTIFTNASPGTTPGIWTIDKSLTFGQGYTIAFSGASNPYQVRYFIRDQQPEYFTQFSGNLLSAAKIAAIFTTLSAQFSYDGVLTPLSSIGFTVPQPDRFLIGRNNIAGNPFNNYLNGHIRKIGYWPKRLSNTTLQALTLSSLGFAKYFAQDKSLYTGTGPGVEVYRNSLGTYFDENGILRVAGPNRPRFDHNPATGESKGLLIEESRTNLFLYSGNPTNSYWSQTDANVAPSHISIDNNQTYAGIVTQTGNLGEFLKNHNPGGIRNITCSAFVKAISSADLFIIRMTGSGGVASFNIVNGTLVSVTSGGTMPTTVSANIQPIGNQWYRCSLTTVYSNPITNITTRMYCLTSSTNSRIGCSYYIWGIQQEDGLFPTSYIPTRTTPTTRAEDVIQINSSSFYTFYNPEQGTFYVKALPLSGSQTAAVIDVGNTLNSIHGIWKSGEGGDGSIGTQWNTFSNAYFLSAGAQYTILTSNFTSVVDAANSASYIAYTYGPSLFATSISSTLISQTTAVSAQPSFDGFSYFNGHIQSLEYYNTQLTLQQLTALSN